MPPILHYWPFNDPVAIVACVLLTAGVLDWIVSRRKKP
jgi:hypothetical protein